MTVIIKYITDNSTTPSDKVMDINDSLTSEHLPTLSADGYVFVGWVHVNKDGHESSLSERMKLSTNWLRLNSNTNEHYVIFTAKWNKKSASNNAVLYTPQTLTSEQQAQARQNIGARKAVDVDSTVKIGYVTLVADSWVGNTSPFSQIVHIDGVTKNSQVDLTPSVEQLSVFYEKDITFVTENEDGVVTIYVIGQKPINDYTIQVTITEVVV